jgi:serine/threonine-protein kinase
MPPRYLLYAQGANLMVAPFDAGRMEVTGGPVPVIEGVLSQLTGSAQYSVSRTGSLIYVPGNMQAVERRLMWVTRNGTEEALPIPLRAYESPRLSPDGRRLAIAVNGQIWLYDFSRHTLARFTFEGNVNSRPVWTPDGERIAFYSDKDGPLNLYWQMADGSGSLERLTTANHTQVPHSWSPNGQSLAFQDVDPVGGDIWILNLRDRKTQPLLKTPFAKNNPRFSPDGRWIAYESDQSGRNEIYVRPYPGPGGQSQVSTDGGSEPVWSRTGRELFYRNGDKMMAAPIVTDPSFSVGKPEMLFEAPYASVAVRVPNYDVSPDGQRFLMIKVSEPTTPPTRINVVVNWIEELKRRVPAK